MRDLEDKYLEGDKRAVLTYNKYVRRITDFISSYYVLLNKADVIVFTAGVGENSPLMREMVCDNLKCLGVKIDKEKNKVRGKLAKISTDDSKVLVYVIPTDEELMIARDTLDIIKSL
jgi:acetate kinase